MELKTNNLSVGYGSKAIIPLKELNIHLKAGQLVVLLGRNGTGKSTLLKTLMGMIPPVEGKVLLNDVDVYKLHPRERAKTIAGMLTGISKSGLLKVSELIATGRYAYETGFGQEADLKDKILNAATQTGATHLLHKKLNQISDGELQRAMTARMLVQEAQFWLMDEPAAFLDMSGRFQLYQLLKKASVEWGKGVLLSTHDLELAGHEGVICWLVHQDGLTVLPGSNETKSQIADYFCHAHEL